MLYTLENPFCGLRCNVCRGPSPVSKFVIGGTGFCGCRCCHWDYHSFLLQTSIPDTDVLAANLLSDVACGVYFLAVDRKRKTLVIACRGTLSVADAITDLNAHEISLRHHGYPDSYTHQGILHNTEWVWNHIKEQGAMKKFLDKNPDYSLTVVGHSLGAGTASLLTLLISRDPNFKTKPIKCFAYAPPPLLDLVLAKHQRTEELISTIVFDHDIIPQTSLSNLLYLKKDMGKVFEHAANSKWKVFGGVLRKKQSQLWLPDFDAGDFEPEFIRVEREERKKSTFRKYNKR